MRDQSGATTHELKTLPQYWDAVKRGDKTFEVRRDDRGFQKGDLVQLVRLADGGFSGYDLDWAGNKKVILRRIRWILTGGQFGIEPGFVVLQLEEVDNHA
jgi:hypothetical protein